MFLKNALCILFFMRFVWNIAFLSSVRLIDWLIDLRTAWSFGWLIDRSIDWLMFACFSLNFLSVIFMHNFFTNKIFCCCFPPVGKPEKSTQKSMDKERNNRLKQLEHELVNARSELNVDCLLVGLLKNKSLLSFITRYVASVPSWNSHFLERNAPGVTHKSTQNQQSGATDRPISPRSAGYEVKWRLECRP